MVSHEPEEASMMRALGKRSAQSWSPSSYGAEGFLEVECVSAQTPGGDKRSISNAQRPKVREVAQLAKVPTAKPQNLSLVMYAEGGGNRPTLVIL